MVRPLTNKEKCFAELVVENERNKKLFEMACEEFNKMDICVEENKHVTLDFLTNNCTGEEGACRQCWQKYFEEKGEEEE
jgi:hypothetical protein